MFYEMVDFSSTDNFETLRLGLIYTFCRYISTSIPKAETLICSFSMEVVLNF